MKLTTKTGLSFISLSAIFFLFGSVFMYFAVRVILAEDLSSRLYQMQNDFIENLNEDNDINLLKSKHVFINQTDKNSITNFSDTVNPTLVLGSTEYGSRIRVCSLHCTKCPLI